MSPRLYEQELRRRAVGGVRWEVEAFGTGAPDSRLIRREGLIAAVVPASPKRSVFNSVQYDDPRQLLDALDELAATYEAAGVRAWTVWVPGADRATAAKLAERGHALDGVPRAMALDLGEPAGEPPVPEGVEVGPLEPAACAFLNDRAYGYEEVDGGFRSGFSGETAIRWLGAFAGEEPLACVGTIDAGPDCCISGVATPPEHRRRGLASWLLWRALCGARERGHESASLRASAAGAPLYERLGFRDFGLVEMWEMRR